MTPDDTIIEAAYETVKSLQFHNNTLRIENDHLRADLVNVTRDNARLVAKVRELEARQSVCDRSNCLIL